MSGKVQSVPASWEIVPLGDLLRVEYGKSLPAKSRRSGDVAVWASAGVVGSHDEALTEGTHLIIGRKGAAGKVMLAEGALWVVDTAYYAPVPDALNPHFVAHQLTAANLRQLDQSTAVPSLSRDDLHRVSVMLPPRSEQDRIVAQLDELLALVATGAASFAQASDGLRTFRRTVLQAALSECVVPLAESGSTGSDRSLPPLPEGWHWSTVVEEGKVQLGRMLSQERHQGPNMRAYLRVANVLDDAIDYSDVKRMDFPPDEFTRYRLHPGDILLNEGQSPELLGRPAMYRGEMADVCFQKTLLRFQAGDRVDPEYALLVFLHYLYAGRFRRESRITTGIGHLTGVRFAAMEFPVAPLNEQRRIVREVRAQLSAADDYAKQFSRLAMEANRLRASLLADAFSGRLVPQADRGAGVREMLQRVAEFNDAYALKQRAARKKSRAVLGGE